MVVTNVLTEIRCIDSLCLTLSRVSRVNGFSSDAGQSHVKQGRDSLYQTSLVVMLFSPLAQPPQQLFIVGVCHASWTSWLYFITTIKDKRSLNYRSSLRGAVSHSDRVIPDVRTNLEINNGSHIAIHTPPILSQVWIIWKYRRPPHNNFKM